MIPPSSETGEWLKFDRCYCCSYLVLVAVSADVVAVVVAAVAAAAVAFRPVADAFLEQLFLTASKISVGSKIHRKIILRNRLVPP